MPIMSWLLNELPEFRRNVLEVMGQPLEDGNITVYRASTRSINPPAVMLVAAMNPCVCKTAISMKINCKSVCTCREYKHYTSLR